MVKKFTNSVSAIQIMMNKKLNKLDSYAFSPVIVQTRKCYDNLIPGECFLCPTLFSAN